MNDIGCSSQVKLGLFGLKDQPDRFDAHCMLIWDGLSNAEREQLGQLLYKGPVWDGSVISKSDRNTLIGYGLATRCCFMGEDGYTAATYLGGSVYRRSKAQPMKTERGTLG